jgi:sigma-B regulation protein RsbU (phosphoserine phosphatase)
MVSQIDPGDKLVLFTDGLFECVNRKGEMLGLANLLEFFKKHIDSPWDGFLGKLKSLLVDYSYDKSRVDDTTFIRIDIK